MSGKEQPAKEKLDEWLTTIQSVTCFTQKLRVYAPICKGKDVVNELVNRVNEILGGSTTFNMAT